MRKKSSSNLFGIGQLPDPKTVNVPGLVEGMREVYRDTVSSLLADLEVAAMALEARQDIDGNTSLIRRLLHSIKGDSGMAGLTEVSDICHQTESAFEKITDISASADMILKVKDWIEAVIAYILEGDVFADKQPPKEIKEKSKLRALIIDDDKVCRQRLLSMLQDFFECSFAVNGRKGLEAYIESRQQNNPYDFITLDINMPELNGHETLQAIRDWENENSSDRVNGVKIIMITSERASKHIFSSFKHGCEAYVTKSDIGEKLLDEIAKLGLLKIVKVQKDYAIS